MKKIGETGGESGNYAGEDGREKFIENLLLQQAYEKTLTPDQYHPYSLFLSDQGSEWDGIWGRGKVVEDLNQLEAFQEERITQDELDEITRHAITTSVEIKKILNDMKPALRLMGLTAMQYEGGTLRTPLVKFTPVDTPRAEQPVTYDGTLNPKITPNSNVTGRATVTESDAQPIIDQTVLRAAVDISQQTPRQM
ncbi:MAG: hypothetical protein LBM73_01185 [Candidatus Nomurabacteria bacterium]|nr:hypothetical protein [Candidatus Nomurabacteria bacterium]